MNCCSIIIFLARQPINTKPGYTQHKEILCKKKIINQIELSANIARRFQQEI